MSQSHTVHAGQPASASASAHPPAAAAAAAAKAWDTIQKRMHTWPHDTSNSAPVDGVLRSAFLTLRSLRLGSLYLSHFVDSTLRSWVDQLIIGWWREIDPLATKQLEAFGSWTAPRRFQQDINKFILQSVNRAVQQAHDNIQTMMDKIIQFDKMILECGVVGQSMVDQFHRLVGTLFTASLSVRLTLADSADRPQRSELLQELLFKYYRLNFRAFHRCAIEKEPADEGASIDETMEATEREEAAEADQIDEATHMQTTNNTPEETLQQFAHTCSLLLSIHFIGSSAGDALSSTSSSSSSSVLPVPSWISASHFLDFFFILIEKYLRHTCLGVWDVDRLPAVNAWMEERVKPFLEIILIGQRGGTNQPNSKAKGTTHHRRRSFEHWYSRLHFYCMECFGLMRIREEMFDLIKDYPDSLPALRDLSTLLDITNQHRILIEAIATVFRTRLLQPGTNTRSILEQYANTIACCRILDPDSNHSLLAGVLTASGIGSYVKQRPDAVRNVVRAIWGSMESRAQADDGDQKASDPIDGASSDDEPAVSNPLDVDVGGGLDLLSELESVPDVTHFGDDSDAEDAVGDTELDAREAWHPDPLSGGSIRAADNVSTRYLKNADVLSLLIDLCGNGERNEELLLLEYKTFLSDRLLSKRSRSHRSSHRSRVDVRLQDPKDPLYDVELEVTHLELMKLRFGDANASLMDVEVMIKDIVNSKRIRTQIATTTPNTNGGASTSTSTAEPLTQFHTELINQHSRAAAAGDESTATSSSATLSTALTLAPAFNALLLSSEFWPDLVDDDAVDFRMPRMMQAILDSYATLFHKLKKPRQLDWITTAPAHKGNAVWVELEMKDGRTEQVECEPIHVAIMEKFAEPDDPTTQGDERTEWSITDLAAALEVDDEDALDSKLQFWVQRGFLRLRPSDDDSRVYDLIEVKSAIDDDDDVGVGGESAAAAEQGNEKQMREQDAQVETYVLGSLGNFASLSVDKLHTMMKTISSSVSGFLYTKSESELKVQLTSMQQRGLLVLKDGHSWAKPTANTK